MVRLITHGSDPGVVVVPDQGTNSTGPGGSRYLHRGVCSCVAPLGILLSYLLARSRRLAMAELRCTRRMSLSLRSPTFSCQVLEQEVLSTPFPAYLISRQYVCKCLAECSSAPVGRRQAEPANALPPPLPFVHCPPHDRLRLAPELLGHWDRIIARAPPHTRGEGRRWRAVYLACVVCGPEHVQATPL
jgi:hypothetical protein